MTLRKLLLASVASLALMGLPHGFLIGVAAQPTAQQRREVQDQVVAISQSMRQTRDQIISLPFRYDRNRSKYDTAYWDRWRQWQREEKDRLDAFMADLQRQRDALNAWLRATEVPGRCGYPHSPPSYCGLLPN